MHYEKGMTLEEFEKANTDQLFEQFEESLEGTGATSKDPDRYAVRASENIEKIYQDTRYDVEGKETYLSIDRLAEEIYQKTKGPLGLIKIDIETLKDFFHEKFGPQEYVMVKMYTDFI